MCISWDPAKKWSHSALVPFNNHSARRASISVAWEVTFMSDRTNLLIEARPKSWQTAAEHWAEAFDEKGKVLHMNWDAVTVQGNQRWKSVYEAADGPRSGTTGFSLKHKWSCILHHWKLQFNIKPVGLWMAAYVFLGARMTYQTRPGNHSSTEWPHSECLVTEGTCVKAAHTCHQANLNPSKKILKSKVWWLLGKADTTRGRSVKNQINKKMKVSHIFMTICSISQAVGFGPEGGNFLRKEPDNKYRFFRP